MLLFYFADVDSLNAFVSGIEGFVTGVSGVEGVDDGEEDELQLSSSSVDSDDVDSEFTDENDICVTNSADLNSKNTEGDGDVILDIDKLMSILQGFAMPLEYLKAKSVKEPNVPKSSLNSFNSTVDNVIKQHEQEESSSRVNIIPATVSGTGLYVLNDTDSLSVISSSHSNSKLPDPDNLDDFNSDDEAYDSENQDNGAFMREYEVIKKHVSKFDLTVVY